MDTNEVGPSRPAADDAERVGLAPGERYRCAACGNLTRFDVEVTERARWYWHADLSGHGNIDEQQRETTVHRISCRWCGADDVVVEPRPAATISPPDGGQASAMEPDGGQASAMEPDGGQASAMEPDAGEASAMTEQERTAR